MALSRKMEQALLAVMINEDRTNEHDRAMVNLLCTARRSLLDATLLVDVGWCRVCKPSKGETRTSCVQCGGPI